MTRLQKRLEELELIQNNTKLLNELLSHYKPDTGGEQEKLLIMVHTVLNFRLRMRLCRCNSQNECFMGYNEALTESCNHLLARNVFAL